MKQSGRHAHGPLARRMCWVLAIAVLVFGLSRIRFESDVLGLMPMKVPEVRGLKVFQEHFTESSQVLVTLESAAVSVGRLAELAESLAGAFAGESEWVRDSQWREDRLQSGLGGLDWVAYFWLNQPANEFQSWAERWKPEVARTRLRNAMETLETAFSPEIMARLAYDPLGVTAPPDPVQEFADRMAADGASPFVSSDGRFRVVTLDLARSALNHRDAAEMWRRLRDREHGWRDGLRDDTERAVAVRYTGGPIFNAEIGSAMERDMTLSVLGTLCFVLILFGAAHRGYRPLVWVILCLALTVAGALAFGGLVLGRLNVISVGFAALLIGLGVDYALVLFQEARTAVDAGEVDPGDAVSVRRRMGRSIVGAACTTSAGFACLVFSGFPGISDLGVLVSFGVLLAAGVMLYVFLPRAMGPLPGPLAAPPPVPTRPVPGHTRAAWGATVLLALWGLGTMLIEGIRVDASDRPLRQENSEAHSALETLQARLQGERDSLWVILQADSESKVVGAMEIVGDVLRDGQESGVLRDAVLPLGLIPDPAHQRANIRRLAQLERDLDAIRPVAAAEGFLPEALTVADQILHALRRAANHLRSESGTAWWPENADSVGMHRIVARQPVASTFTALGRVVPGQGGEPGGESGGATVARTLRDSLRADVARQRPDLADVSIWVTQWDLLGPILLGQMRADLLRVGVPVSVLVLFVLWLAFRSLSETALSVATLCLGGLTLIGVMGVLDWEWNLMNLIAVPLLMGVGVDFSIHMQFAMRRNRGNVRAAWRSTGRALFLCGATTIAGFGSLAWSSNQGLASLGRTCALGVACVLVSAVLLLPAWWRACRPGAGAEGQPPGPGRFRPPALYQAGFWRLGQWIAALAPYPVLVVCARWAGAITGRLSASRRAVVMENMAPCMAPSESHRLSGLSLELYRQFAVKLVDLLRFEAGCPVAGLFRHSEGWEHLEAAVARRRGVLLVTMHLGNWELGAPWITSKNIPLNVITLEEPASGLTRLRIRSRARAGVRTCVIGNDPFSLVPVIARLRQGEAVAMLIDRPSESSRVPVEFFGRPFPASIGAAELARASGSAILPVSILRGPDGYGARVHPEIHYDPQKLADLDARIALTRDLVQAFEPWVEEYLTQWYHFVPAWDIPPDRHATR